MILSRAVLAGGCFWKLQPAFKNIDGIISVQGGYTGGRVPNPTYMEISSGRTGHVEALEIIYDGQLINYSRLLDIFFASHDPTQLNRQGEDVGAQYRSAIFYTTEEQKQAALNKISELQNKMKYAFPIVTEIIPAGIFYPAAPHIEAVKAAFGRSAGLRH